MTRVIRSPLPANSEGIWLLDGRDISASVVVSFDAETRNLRLSMFRGDPKQDWRALAAEHFPEAETVSFQRLEAGGFRERPMLRLKPTAQPLPVSAEPRVLLTEPAVWRWAVLFIGVLLFVGIAAWGAIEAATIWADRAERAWAGHSFTNGGGR